MIKKRYPKGSAWKRANWDKWTPWRKVRHVIAIFFAAITVSVMFGIFLTCILFMFGIQGAFMQLRDAILLDIMNWIF